MEKTNVSEMKDCVNQFVQVVEELKYKRKVCNQQEVEIETLLKQKLELENVNHDLSNNLTSVKSFAEKLQEDKERQKCTSKEKTSINDKCELQSQLNSANSVIISMKKENSELHLQNHQKKSALEIADQKYLSLEKTYSFVKETVEHLKEETKGLKNAQKNFRSVYENLKGNLEAVKNINKNLAVKLKHKDCVYAALNEKKKLLDAKIVELETRLTQNSNLENEDKNPVVLSLKSELKLLNEKYEGLSNIYKTVHEELKTSENALKQMTESNKNAHRMLLQQSMQDALLDELREQLHDQKQRNSELENRLKVAEDKTTENNLKSVIGEKENEISSFQSEIIQLKDESTQKSSNILSLNLEISNLNMKCKHAEEKVAKIFEEKKAKEVECDTKETQTLVNIVDDEVKGKNIEEKSQSISESKNATEVPISSSLVSDAPQVLHDSVKVVSQDGVDTTKEQHKKLKSEEKERKTDILSSKCVIHDGQVDVSSPKVDLSPILFANNDFKQVKNLPEVAAVFNISDLNTQTVKCEKVCESHLENVPMNNEFDCINNLKPPEEFISTYDVGQIRNAEKRKICIDQDTAVEEIKISKTVDELLPCTSQESKHDSSRVDAFVIPDSPLSVSSGPPHDTVDNRLIAVVSPRIQTKQRNPVSLVEKTDPMSAQMQKDEKRTAKVTPKVIPLFPSQDEEDSPALSDKKKAKKRKILSRTPPMLEDLEPCTQTQESNVEVSYKSNLSSVSKFSKDVKSSAKELRRRNSNSFSHRYYSPDPVDINDISDNEEDSQHAFRK